MLESWGRYESYARALLRIAAGFMFSLHGCQKLLGAFGGMPPGGATAAMGTLPWFAGVLELGGGTLMIVGLLTRPVAFLISGQMAYAYFTVHYPQGFWPILNRGELAALYSFVWLYFAAAGPGAWALDPLLGRRSRIRA